MDLSCRPIKQKGEMALVAAWGGAARRAALRGRKSHLINYSWGITSKRCKIFHFFSFLLTFGGWDWNHFVQNFMENNSIKNFEAWKAEESAEKCLWRCTPMLSLIGWVTWLFWELEPKYDIWNRKWPVRTLRGYVQTTSDKSNQPGQVCWRWAGPLGRYSRRRDPS